MVIKKCINCGSFISSENALCDECANRMTYENTLLKNFFDENSSFDSISSISAVTGISPNKIQNYMVQNNYVDDSLKSSSNFSSIQY